MEELTEQEMIGILQAQLKATQDELEAVNCLRLVFIKIAEDNLDGWTECKKQLQSATDKGFNEGIEQMCEVMKALCQEPISYDALCEKFRALKRKEVK